VYTATNELTPPSSRVAALPAESYAAIPLIWSGEENTDGVGIAYFDIFVSIDGGPFGVWLAQTRANGAVFLGELEHSYAFYSKATDFAGNTEPAPGTPDAQTRVTLTNRPPVIAPIPNCATNEGAVFVKQVTASD